MSPGTASSMTMWVTISDSFLETCYRRRNSSYRASFFLPGRCSSSSAECCCCGTSSLHGGSNWAGLHNTGQFDVTGHPAISVPCGMADGLPIGMMMVGKHFDDKTVIRVADAFENIGDWREM